MCLQCVEMFGLQFSIQHLGNILWPEVQIIALHFYHEDQLSLFDMQNQHIPAYLSDQTAHYRVQDPIHVQI